MNVLDTTNRISYGTTESDRKTSTPIVKKVNLEVNDDIRQQINENSKKLNKILKKLIISDEIQEKLLQINRDMNSLKQRVN